LLCARADGRLIYELLGTRAEADFMSSWGIGVGLGQVQDMKGVLVSAMEAVLVLTVLEMLWLQSNSTWMESMTDFASVYAAALMDGVGNDGKAEKRGFLRRFKTYRVCERYAAFANALT
jgi:hypothetical protein